MPIVGLSESKNTTSSIFSLMDKDRSLLELKTQLYCLKGFFFFFCFILCPKIVPEKLRPLAYCCDDHNKSKFRAAFSMLSK